LLINALFPCVSEALCELALTISGGGESFIFPLPLLQRGLQHNPFAFADLDGGQTGYTLNFAAAQAMGGGLTAANEAGGLGQ